MSKFLYFLNYKIEEKALCQFEMKYLFQVNIEHKYFFSDLDIAVSRSVFIKSKIEILEVSDNYQDLLKTLDGKYQVDNYKVVFINHEKLSFNYRQRLKMASEIGYTIIGDFNMHDPSNYVGVTKIANKYYVGILNQSDTSWQKHRDKPENFSSSLSIRVARSVINIAVGNNTQTRVIDPCCGMGTVLLEALALGINIEGSDLSYLNVASTKKNLAYYHYNCQVQQKNIVDITKHYDVAIIDLPYGLAMVTDQMSQNLILENAYRISDVLVLIVNNCRKQQLLALGYKIVDETYVIKQQFKRYIYYCKKA